LIKKAVKASLLLLLILLVSQLSVSAKINVVFKKNINNKLLTIKSEKAYMSGSKKIFLDKSKQFKVYVTYGDLKIRANKASFDFSKKVIELYAGFNGEFEQYKVSGEYFRINPKTGYYVGRKLKLAYLFASLHGEEFQFYGDYILIQDISTNPLQYPIFNLHINKLEAHPGYSLAYGNTLRFFNIPFYFIPLYIEDGRRSYFDLAFPAFEIKSDIFHDSQVALHTHYFFNAKIFGDLSIRKSELDGYGLQVQQILRLNDNNQMQLKVLGWEKSAMQTKFSYVIQLFDNPREKATSDWNFLKRQRMEEKVATVEPKLVLRTDYSQNEEIQRSIVNRTPDISLAGVLRGILYDHKYTLIPAFHYGKLSETRIYPEDQAPQDVNREYDRVKGELGFNYYLETPHFKPVINRLLWEVDFEHSVYDPGNTSVGRLSTAFTARRPIFKKFGLFFETTLTKMLIDYGTSPFYFEQYGRLMDSATFDIYLQRQSLIAGNRLIYDITHMEAYNELFYFGLKTGRNYAIVQFNRRLKSWEFAFMIKESAF
jgi:hypothetical protein